MSINLPRDGAVLIIDDKYNEVKPLLEALHKKAVPTVYYQGNESAKLPDSPLQKVRLAFVDLQLFPIGDEHTYAQNIMRLLDSLISSKNGPYILILWSTTLDVNGPELISQINSEKFEKRPIICLSFNKMDFFKHDFDRDGLQNHLDFLDRELGSYFDEDDLNVLKERTEIYYSDDRKLVPEGDVLKNILEKIENALKNMESFTYFTGWENLTHISGRDTTHDFFSLYELDNNWDQNTINIFHLLAKARIGEKVNDLTKKDFIKNSFRTINLSLIDRIDKSEHTEKISSKISPQNSNAVITRNIDDKKCVVNQLKSGRYTLYINNSKRGERSDYRDLYKIIQNDPPFKEKIQKMLKEYESIRPKINSNILFDFHPEKILFPGNIYEMEVKGHRIRRLLKNYLEPSQLYKKNDNKYYFRIDHLKQFKFIELEVSPICDLAHGKLLKSRLLPGIIYPEDTKLAIKHRGSFNTSLPTFYFKGKLYSICFDFRLFKSVNIDFMKDRKAILRLKKEPLMDIVNDLSSHVSRVGITLID